MDERVAIRVNGLVPGGRVTIRAASRDQTGVWWRSTADFVASPDGSIDLSTMAPVYGSYTGIDAMGLFWSMRPEGEARRLPSFFASADPFKPIETTVEALYGNRSLAALCLTRFFAGPGVQAERVNKDGVVGIVYRPRDAQRRSAVILLGGSEGGYPEPEGAMLASRGFIALALAYFGVDGLPPTMQNIPVEYFGRALQWLQRSALIRHPRVTILGCSRGAEAALIAGSTYPEVNGVIAVAPSHVRWEGATARMLPGGPAWVHEGNPLPYVPFHIGPTFMARYVWGSLTRRPVALQPMFVASLHRIKGADVEIPVERIRGPILLGSGQADRKWPSDMMARRIMDRLKRHSHPFADAHMSYEGVGHWLPCAYVPSGGLQWRMQGEIGGTPAAQAAAQRRWWPEVLQFLSALDEAGGTREQPLSHDRGSVRRTRMVRDRTPCESLGAEHGGGVDADGAEDRR
jgi:dienelactone hydrolase